MNVLDRAVAAENGVVKKELPVRMLQFGEGNFLRAFIDWMVAEMNDQGLFNGRVSVVQPLEHGMLEMMEQQDYLYTLLLRGIQDGEVVVKQRLVDVIERGVNVYSQFDQYLAEAENPELRIIVSNTTEAGIVLRSEDAPTDAPPISFPGKLLRLMKHRYDCFDGDPAKGFLLFPCELIDRNGDTLKAVLTELAQAWYPGDAGFQAWLTDANVYFNTLVDRIVSGYPRDEAESLCRGFGYTDNLVDTGEIFHFLVVEGPREYESEFPLITAGLNVKWCDDLTPYRTRKVRILNGAHTMTVLAAHLYGLSTVKECMDDEVLSRYVRKGVLEEIIPTLDLPEEELLEFGEAVMERFSNPYIKHFLLAISLNSVSKFKTRVLPSLLEYQARKGELPELLTFSLAALVLFYRGETRGEHTMSATRQVDGQAYEISDSPEVLDWFFDLWQGEAGDSNAACTVIMGKVLAKEEFWGADLNRIEELQARSGEYLAAMIAEGVVAVLNRVAN
jgi:tagaturonate reductase